MEGKVGVIGYGNIGSAVVKSILRNGFNPTNLYVCDKSSIAQKSIEEMGVNWISNPVGIAEECDVVITALPAPVHVRSVMEGDGVLKNMKQGSLWIDHTTTDPKEPPRYFGITSQLGIDYLESPLTGGLALLQIGRMTVFCGSHDLSVMKRAMPLLKCYTQKQLWMGKHGSANIVKIISNMLAGAHLVLAGEAVMLAKRAGVDLTSMYDGIRVSAGNSFVFETEVPLFFNGSYDPGFTVALHCKDLNIGYELAREVKVPLNMLGLTEQTYLKTLAKYGPSVGSSSPAKLMEDELGESMRVDGWDNWSYSIEDVGEDGLGVVHLNRPVAKL